MTSDDLVTQLRALGQRLGDPQLTALLAEAQATITALSAEKDSYEQEIRQMLWLSHGCVTALYGDDGEMQCSRHRLDFKRQPLDELREAVRLMKWQLLGERAEQQKAAEAEQQRLTEALASIKEAAIQVCEEAMGQPEDELWIVEQQYIKQLSDALAATGRT